MKIKSFFTPIILAVILTLLVTFPVFAQPEAQESPPLDFLAGLITPELVKQLTTLLGLIILQVVLAVALAIREKIFDWKQLADFYRSMVAPFVISWLVFVFAVKLISVDLLGPQYSGLVGDGVTWLSWLAVVTTLGARIVETAKKLFGPLLPIKEPPVGP